jgi:hypothetical protein
VTQHIDIELTHEQVFWKYSEHHNQILKCSLIISVVLLLWRSATIRISCGVITITWRRGCHFNIFGGGRFLSISTSAAAVINDQTYWDDRSNSY